MEENILLPFPSDYDEKLKVSSLDPNILRYLLYKAIPILTSTTLMLEK